MKPFPIDRRRPPSRVEYARDGRELVLRPYQFADVDALIDAVAASVEELKHFMPWAHAPVTREGEFDLVSRFQSQYWAGNEYIFGVFDSSGALVGGCGIHPRTPLNSFALEIGYWSHSAFAGRGNTTLASRMMAVLAFDRFECDRLQVMHDEANAASRRVVEKCGFVYEGTLRNATAAVTPEVRAGGYAGTGLHRMYAITRDEYASLPWVGEVRSAMTYVDALGGRVAATEGVSTSV